MGLLNTQKFYAQFHEFLTHKNPSLTYSFNNRFFHDGTLLVNLINLLKETLKQPG